MTIPTCKAWLPGQRQLVVITVHVWVCHQPSYSLPSIDCMLRSSYLAETGSEGADLLQQRQDHNELTSCSRASSSLRMPSFLAAPACRCAADTWVTTASRKMTAASSSLCCSCTQHLHFSHCQHTHGQGMRCLKEHRMPNPCH